MSPPLSLPAELTIYTAAATRQAWLDALVAAGSAPMQVEAAGVSDIDSAGLQLLVALQRSLAARQQALRLVAPSEVLRTACARSGLSDTLIDGGRA